MDTADSPVLPVDKRRQEHRPLNGKQEAYAQAYVRYGNCVKAYLEAGYLASVDGIPSKALANRAYAIMRHPGVRRRIAEIREQTEARRQDKAELTRDWVVAEHQRLLEVAEKDGNLAVATDNLIALGKTLGLYSEGITIDLGQLRAYSESEAIEAKRLASIMLEHGDKPATALPQAAQCEHTMPADIPGNARVLPDSDESTPPSPPNGPGVNSRPSPEPTQ